MQPLRTRRTRKPTNRLPKFNATSMDKVSETTNNSYSLVFNKLAVVNHMVEGANVEIKAEVEEDTSPTKMIDPALRTEIKHLACKTEVVPNLEVHLRMEPELILNLEASAGAVVKMIIELMIVGQSS